jgi:hypothetical protein
MDSGLRVDKRDLAIGLPMSFERNLNIVVKLNRNGNEASGHFFCAAQVISKSFDEGVSGKGVQQGCVQFLPHVRRAGSPGQQSRNKAKQQGDCEWEKIHHDPPAKDSIPKSGARALASTLNPPIAFPNTTTTITAGMRRTNPPTTVVLMKPSLLFICPSRTENWFPTKPICRWQ